MGGRACIRGMRITVSLVLSLLANRMTVEEILRDYPDLEAEDIHACLQYAAFLADEEIRSFADTKPSGFWQIKRLLEKIRNLLPDKAREVENLVDFLLLEFSTTHLCFRGG